MNLRKGLLFSVIQIILCLIVLDITSAKADLSLTVSDITFSRDTALAGEKTRIFARVFNLGDEDVCGFVIFSINGKSAGDPQAISVKVGTYDDVFIDWVFEKGDYDIGAGIVGAQPQDENPGNNLVLKNDYFVDSDLDRDGVGDKNDDDSDNDGLANDEELVLKTDPHKFDTDGDQISDKDDIFPLDLSEWQDSDSDGLGNNLDKDDDNDSLSDGEELVLGTSSFKVDTDGDLIPDKTEAKIGFLKPNRNEWAVANKFLGSAVSAVKSAVQEGNVQVGYLFAVFGFLSIVFFISRFLHKD